MKKILFLLAITVLASCTNPEKDFAEIYLQSDKVNFIEVRNALEDVYIWDMKNDTIYPNKENEFRFKKKIDNPEHISIKIGDKYLQSILLPNHKIELAQVDSLFVFQGDNKAGMDLLNSFKRPYNFFAEFKNDSTSVQITEKIDTQKKEELENVKKLRDNNEIDEDLAKVLNEEIDYFYAQKAYQVSLSKFYRTTPPDKDLLALAQSTLNKYPLETRYKPSNWLNYAKTVLLDGRRDSLYQNKILVIDSIRAWQKSGKWLPYQFDLISGYKNPRIAEKVAANFIMTTSKQRKFEKGLPTAFYDFKEKYPNSLYTKYLTPEIKITEDYFEKITGEMPSDVEFLDGKDISNMGELLNKLKGEKYFVDVWATWCGPCKAEFEFNDGLDDLLSKKGYKKLYISIDRAEMEDKWKQDVKYFDLSGLHLLASPEFANDYRQNHSLKKGKAIIPQYLIFDEKGNIVTKDAPRPSDLAELEKVLL